MQSVINAIQRILGTEKSAHATESGELLVTPSGAKFEEITRGGYSFSVITTTATASLVALPTTAAGIGLWNSAPDGGKSMIVDAIFAIHIVGEATLNQAGLIYYMGSGREAALTQALIPRKLNSLGPNSDTVAICAAGGAIMTSGAATSWVPIGPTANISLVSTPGAILWCPIDGRLIIPPGRQFGVNVMCNDVTNTFNCGVMWHEKQLTLV
ncbi:MAG: hypothetical protein WC364_05695 [Eubacteriales bacterium]|jgi:hypothetical protein